MFSGGIENNTPVANKILCMKNANIYSFLPKFNAFNPYKKKVKMKKKIQETVSDLTDGLAVLITMVNPKQKLRTFFWVMTIIFT